MTESLFVFILLIHFLADFGLQTHQQAQLKSTSNMALLQHVGVYSAIWFVAVLSLTSDPVISLLFATTTFGCHFVTDWVTSRFSKKFFDNNNFHDGFVVVGFDQMLHYLQLYYTFKLFIN